MIPTTRVNNNPNIVPTKKKAAPINMQSYIEVNDMPEKDNLKYEIRVIKRFKENLRTGKVKDTTIFNNPDLIADEFINYLIDIGASPMILKDYVGKEGKEVNRERPRPPSLLGFVNYLGVGRSFWYEGVKNRKSNKDISTIVECIEDVCKAHAIEGAANYTYNPNLVARLYGITDKQELVVTQNVNYSTLSTTELNDRVNKIKELTKHKLTNDAIDTKFESV